MYGYILMRAYFDYFIAIPFSSKDLEMKLALADRHSDGSRPTY